MEDFERVSNDSCCECRARSCVRAFDEMLVEHCAPTLSGLKTANLFNFPLYKNSPESISALIEKHGSDLGCKGVTLHELGKKDGRMLVYVCRINMLEADLGREGVADFMQEYGYGGLTVQQSIDRLSSRLNGHKSFPHEIGLFLGYPLDDVKGFIENSGQNYKCVGDWKVYCNEAETVRRFIMYKKCKKVYTKLFAEHSKSVYQLTVAMS